MDRTNGAGHVNRQFVAEDVASNRPPTEVTAEWLNGIQEELVNVITSSGLVPNAADNTQLLVSISQMIAANAITDPGRIAFFVQSTPPAGYIKANGAAVSRSVYANLFAAIGVTYGAGDGATTFGLPDLRGVFLRGLDEGRGIDSGRGLGTIQLDELKSHTHGSTTYGPDGIGARGEFPNGWLDWAYGLTSATGGNETRPINVALLACIKY